MARNYVFSWQPETETAVLLRRAAATVAVTGFDGQHGEPVTARCYVSGF